VLARCCSRWVSFKSRKSVKWQRSLACQLLPEKIRTEFVLSESESFLVGMESGCPVLVVQGDVWGLADFLSEYIVTTPGYFCDFDTGDRIGRVLVFHWDSFLDGLMVCRLDSAPHDGCEVYTVGQGARIPGEARRWFVVSKNLGSGTVYVTSNKDHPSLYPSGLEVHAMMPRRYFLLIADDQCRWMRARSIGYLAKYVTTCIKGWACGAALSYGTAKHRLG
jgi:hypothetical protein